MRLADLRFHALRHHAITELAESQASDSTIMSIAGHVSPKMLAHYSHIRIEAKRTALDALVELERKGSHDTSRDTNYGNFSAKSSQVFDKFGGDDETRTRDLCRDRREVIRWRTQNQQVTRAVVGCHWRYRVSLGHCVIRVVIRPDTVSRVGVPA